MASQPHSLPLFRFLDRWAPARHVAAGPPVMGPVELQQIMADIEAGLRKIDFPEVSPEDRVTFLESAAECHERHAVEGGRTDLLFPLRAFVARRRAEILEGDGSGS